MAGILNRKISVRREVSVCGDIAYLPLTRGLVAVIDAADAEIVGAYNWNAFPAGSTFYVRRYSALECGKRSITYLHRELLMPGDGFVVDHINGDALDNRRENLRIATHAENMRNSKIPKNNSSGFVGVRLDKQTGRWRAGISVGGKTQCLGRFKTIQEAVNARARAAETIFGEFLRVL